MEPPKRSDIFQDWNLGGSEVTPDTLARPREPSKPWEMTQDFREPRRESIDPAADFTFNPPGLEARERQAGDPNETIGGPWRGAAHDDRDANLDPNPNPKAKPAPNGPIPFPQCGEGIGGFRLVSELGRGAFGRVYLAEESGLGNRSVALKITRAEGDEPRLLARLQHTHIVPIHSVHDDPETGLRLMCMPYFGGANLAQVLDATGNLHQGKATGRSLVEALDNVCKPSVAPAEPAIVTCETRRRGDSWSMSEAGKSSAHIPMNLGSLAPLKSILGRIPWWSKTPESRAKIRSRFRARSGHKSPTRNASVDDRDPVQPARRFLREASFVRASAWVAARLAEGLEHAHSRGLLHRDLKPSNILIATDGTPMLLDFNLAADAVEAGDANRAMIGGTLPYMAPEHLDAFNPNGTTPPEAVDERSDIYALGLILFEMVAGRPAFDEPPTGRPLLEVVKFMTLERRGPAPSARAINPAIPLSLDAIIRKSLDPEPGRRHARAGDLAEDLRRFLDDRPLKYTREPSLRERFSKWARRNPRITSGSTVGLVSLVVVLATAAAAWTATQHLRQVSSRLKLRVFEARLHECQFLLNTNSGPTEHLGRGIGLAEQALDQAGIDIKSPQPRLDPWLETLPPPDQVTMRSDLAEMILLVARARVTQAERLKSEEKRRKALEEGIVRLDFAEKLDPKPPQALYDDRSRYHSALGNADLAARDRRRRDATPPTTGRDYYLLGTALLARNQPDRAEAALLRAVGLDSRRFWSWFALGLCHYDQARFAESAGDFAVCTVLAPRFAWPWMNRGMALARAGRLVEARESYDRAIEADEQFAEALANRGLANLELGEASVAVIDLKRAVELGRREPEIQAALAEAEYRAGRTAEGLAILARLVELDPDAPLPRVARGMLLIEADPSTAQRDFRKILERNPNQPVAHLGLARLLRQVDPAAALVEADLAVKGDPYRIDALELRAWLKGRLGEMSALLDVDRLVQTPTPRRLYNAACAVAILDQAHPDPTIQARAVDLLRRAIEAGFPPEPAGQDPDFRSLQSLPVFQELVKPRTSTPTLP